MEIVSPLRLCYCFAVLPVHSIYIYPNNELLMRKELTLTLSSDWRTVECSARQQT